MVQGQRPWDVDERCHQATEPFNFSAVLDVLVLKNYVEDYLH